MDLKALECFVTVAEMRNVTRAAEALFMTQPALSRKIAGLEAQCGMALLERGVRPLDLTPAGQLVYERARQMLRLRNALTYDLAQMKQGVDLQLRVEYGMGGHMPILARALEEFQRIYPKVTTYVSLQYNTLAIRHLKEGACDLALVNLPEIAEEKGLQYQTVEAGSLYAYLPRNHRLARRDAIELGDLAGEPLSIYERFASPLMFDKILAIFRNAHIPANFARQAPDTITFTMLVTIYHTIGIMPKHTMTLDAQGIRAIPIVGAQGFDLVAAWNPAHDNSGVRAMRDILTRRAL